MTKFYISDTHFSHTNILKFEADARPFKDLDEHDEELIKRWNERVQINDTIIHLGDVCFKPATSLDRIMRRLNGKKKLILGNHDTLDVDRYSRWFEVLPMLGDQNGVLYTHYPVHPSQLDFRYKVNVHGHCHSNSIKGDKRYVNISCEHTGLAPISEEELLKLVENAKK